MASDVSKANCFSSKLQEGGQNKSPKLRVSKKDTSEVRKTVAFGRGSSKPAKIINKLGSGNHSSATNFEHLNNKYSQFLMPTEPRQDEESHANNTNPSELIAIPNNQEGSKTSVNKKSFISSSHSHKRSRSGQVLNTVSNNLRLSRNKRISPKGSKGSKSRSNSICSGTSNN